MKIAFINTVCGTGSTGRISLELCRMAENHGLDTVFVYGRFDAPSYVHSIKAGTAVDFMHHVLGNFFRDKSGFLSKKRTAFVIRELEKEKPDLIHLHNLHGFYIHVGMLFEYIKENKIPVIWTLHDCWPFTGHCAYYEFAGCDGYTKGCNKCRHHASLYPYALFWDGAGVNFKMKKEAFLNVNQMVLVTPSRWLAGELQKSFLKDYRVQIIPNGIDTQMFTLEEKIKISSSLKTQVNNNSNIRILGVANIWEKRKGFIWFERLAAYLPQGYEIAMSGLNRSQKKKMKKACRNRVGLIFLEKTNDQEKIAEWYRQADVFLNPTLEDNFPTTNLEALACGTPVVTFQTGGSPEMLDCTCGVIVKEKSVAAIYAGIEKARSFDPAACRRKAMEYDKTVRYQEYIKLYLEMGKEKA